MDGSRWRSAGPRTRAASVALVAAGLFLASVVDPGNAGAGTATGSLGPLGLVGVDKWVHAVGYAALALVGTFALALRVDTTRPWPLLGVVTVVAAFGAGIEVVQATLPARSFDVADMAANATGALFAVAAWSLVARRRTADGAGVPTDD
jgi:hypothetical protein